MTQNVELLRSRGIQVVKLLAPEHGFYGTLNNGEDVADEYYQGIPVISVYSENKHDIDKALFEDVDAVLVDIQDSGVRPYTYLTTIKELLKLSAVTGKRVVVADRPNPLSASIVDGPMIERKHLSFVGPDVIPLRYGMTIGELSLYFNREIGADLSISEMDGYRRHMYWHDCMRFFIPPSLNLPTFDSVVNFAGLVMVESSPVSVGRGTPYPFRVFGYKNSWSLDTSNISGLVAKKTKFRPLLGPYSNLFVDGYMLFIEDQRNYNAMFLALRILKHLFEMDRSMINLDHLPMIYGSNDIIRILQSDLNQKEISESWDNQKKDFMEERSNYLLYL